VLLGIAIATSGCASAQIGRPTSTPKIEFTTVPLAGADNSGKTSPIEGRVRGAQPGQRIVVYCHGETQWWVQPRADQPFTKIEDNSKWKNFTHPGSEYGALLVGPDYRPAPTADALPMEDVLASAVTRGEVTIWHRWWFGPLCVMAGAAIILAAHRVRLHEMSKKLHLRFEERLAERTRVAQELHDTLLQGVLSASMQLHVAADQVSDNSPAKPGLNRVLELMAQVIDEGRNTVRGLRSSPIDNAHDLESAFSRVPQELGTPPGVNFHLVVEGTALPLRSLIRDDIYSIGREAMVNAFRHSQSKSVDVELEYAPNHLRILIRDQGCGIDRRVIESGRDGHWGLSGMRERAERIGARLKVMSRIGGGTEVELRLPAEIAFESNSLNRASNWLARLYDRRAETSKREPRQRVG
jgi:signal transduction histidine kinase